MGKKIVILFDGTSNEIEEKRTNVLHLYGCLEKSKQQLVFYDPGVGTMASHQYMYQFMQKTSEVFGLAFGRGIDRNVLEAYRFLVENYQKGDGSNTQRDKIYLIGFSRGAYSARMLAGFIHNFGLMEPRNLNLLEYVYRAYKRIGENNEKKDGGSTQRIDAFKEIRMFENVVQPDRPPIKAMGLFDTVSSVFKPSPRRFIQRRTHANTNNNASVQHVRHAAALHERRRMFRLSEWPKDQTFYTDWRKKEGAGQQDVAEVWFAGCHADIGGGHSEPNSGLAKIALEWMIKELGPLGLKFNDTLVEKLVSGLDPKGTDGKHGHYGGPDAHAKINDSMGKLWKALEYVPLPTIRNTWSGWRRAKEAWREVPEGATLHASVFARCPDKKDLPPNLPKKYKMIGDMNDWSDPKGTK
ncbi:MAG: DUF2235 domain-containing protein [Pseudomonadota bacterium]